MIGVNHFRPFFKLNARTNDDNNNNKRQKIRTRTPSPRKRDNKVKQQLQQQEPAAETEESLERWKDDEVNARFIQALPALDYLGFIKHTKRKGKADHVLRMLFDVADGGFDE